MPWTAILGIFCTVEIPNAKRAVLLEWGGKFASPRDENSLREGGGRLRILSLSDKYRKARGARFCAKSVILMENSIIYLNLVNYTKIHEIHQIPLKSSIFGGIHLNYL